MNTLQIAGLAALGLLFLRSRRQEAPAPVRRRNPVRLGKLSAADRRQLESARAMARTFHGDGEVVELSARERKLSRFVVPLGELPSLEYEPSDGSKRAAYRWVHESGDRGPGQPASEHPPLLAADPVTRRPCIVAMRSPVKFSPKVGLVG